MRVLMHQGPLVGVDPGLQWASIWGWISHRDLLVSRHLYDGACANYANHAQVVKADLSAYIVAHSRTLNIPAGLTAQVLHDTQVLVEYTLAQLN